MEHSQDSNTDALILDFFCQTGNEILNRVNASLKTGDVLQVATILMGRLVQSGNTLRVLLDHANMHDWVWDGASIVRTSYDAMIQALYIFSGESSPESLARRFLDFKVIEQVRLIHLFDKSTADFARSLAQSERRKASEPAILEEFDRVCNKYGIDASKRLPDNWYRSNLREISQKVGYEAEYELLQKKLSAIVHSSVFGIDAIAYLKPIHLIYWQWDFAFRVLERIASYAAIELSEEESRLLDISKKSIFDRPAD